MPLLFLAFSLLSLWHSGGQTYLASPSYYLRGAVSCWQLWDVGTPCLCCWKSPPGASPADMGWMEGSVPVLGVFRLLLGCGCRLACCTLGAVKLKWLCLAPTLGSVIQMIPVGKVVLGSSSPSQRGLPSRSPIIHPQAVWQPCRGESPPWRSRCCAACFWPARFVWGMLECVLCRRGEVVPGLYLA